MERDPVLVDPLHPWHRCIVVFLRSIERPFVEHRKDARRGVPALNSGRNCSDRYQAVAAIDKGELVTKADDDAFWPALGNVAPKKLARLQTLEAEGLEHIERGLRGCVAGLHLGLEGFERRGGRRGCKCSECARTA